MGEKLVVVRGRDKGREVVLSKDILAIGQSDECDIVVKGNNILDRHSVVERNNGRWLIRALDSERLLRIDGRVLPETILSHGNIISFGETEFKFTTSTASIDNTPKSGTTFDDPETAVAKLSAAYKLILNEVGKVVIGQKKVIDEIMTAIFARGHCLLVGVPGLAKTLMIKTLAGTMDLNHNRIQFTPDLMPTDIIGTDILEEDAEGARHFKFNKGPIFTNLLLADEINRTPPKTQAALLEAMQERRVTASGVTYDLPAPFFVLATQNPIEQEGTYPLPEAQLDRFMFCVNVDYPTAEEEAQILLSTTKDFTWTVERIIHGDMIEQFQHLVRQVPVSEHVAKFAATMVRSTRPNEKESPDFIKKWLRWGAGPRAGQYLLLAAKANALLSGRFNVSCGDVRDFALPVLRHRIFCNFSASSEGVGVDDVIKRLVDFVKEPDYK